MTIRTWSVGSKWVRWDPHLHAPGTLLNDQFDNDWDGYIRRIESAAPAAEVLGITDYHTLRGYKEVVRRRNEGKLGSIVLLFPNIELRLTLETKDRSAINLHLLVCPDDEDHVSRVEEKLAQLTFRFREETYYCTDKSLRRLGKAHRGEPRLSDNTALEVGANQFKVELGELRAILESDAWLRRNVVVAVAAGGDGLAGLARDASFAAQRQELGRFAQVVFSGQAADRKYWLGDHPNFETEGQHPKPCLHGCDAHNVARVLEPELGRRCWIRGGATFETLRQTLVDPERRVHIGESPPAGASGADVIRKLVIRGAPWIANGDVALNDGLVTIIGAKGSGKTALADLIAAAAGAAEEDPGPASFIRKAGSLLHGTEVVLEWGDDSQSTAKFPQEAGGDCQPRVRYLSQQFVERLCAPVGLAEPLVDEIERVVFDSIPEEDRLMCSDFSELRAVVLSVPIAERDADRTSIRMRTATVADETRLQRSLPKLRQDAIATSRATKSVADEIAKIPVPGDEKVNALTAASARLQALRAAIQREGRREQQLVDVAAEIQRQVRQAESSLAALKAKHPGLLDEATWETLQLRVDGRSVSALLEAGEVSRTTIARLRTSGLTPEPGIDAAGLERLVQETERLSKELGLDHTNQKRRVELEDRLVKARTAETRATEQLAHAEKAGDRRKEAQVERLVFYASVFRALASEEAALVRLYAPLREKIAKDARLSKLGFTVHRAVDLSGWAVRGENLLDLRRSPLGRRGVLAEHARATLLDAWRQGTPEGARSAMQRFLEEHATPAIEALAQGATHAEFGEWLFSTDHISVRYGIQYEGVDIAHLSPGTRGVVLLTLYLALDDWDTRPLLIDQPEENLDPRSVFSELVPFFRTAAKRRQIIMVTHNANLVVNTDSDQVVVAEAERSSPTTLPCFTYFAGGLEDPEIRRDVCRLLEGGEDAFRKRAQRYGLLADRQPNKVEHE